jgi:hypothetical protein
MFHIAFTCSFARSWLTASVVQVQCQTLTFYVGSAPVTVGYLMPLGYLIIKFCYRAVDFVHNTTVRLIIGPLNNWCTRQFGDEGAAVLEEVAADLGVRGGGRSERRPINRAAQRYGPPPGSAPVARGPALPAEAVSKPSTSAFVSRLLHRPNVDSQAAQLAVAELQLAIRNAQVRPFVCTCTLYCITGM